MAARNLGRLFRDTKKLVLPTVPYITIAPVICGAGIHSFCSALYKENVLTTISTSSSGSQDILLSKIRSLSDTWDVLETVNQHHSIMNDRHILQALRSIFMLQKSQSGGLSNGEVVKSPQFQLLVNTLKSQIRHLEVNELLDVLKCLAFLGVRPTTRIMQILLQLLSKQVNELNLQQITFLDFVMKDFTKTPLVEALNIALPIIFEANLMTMCDLKNVNQLSELLIFVSRRPVHNKCTRIIIDALTDQRKNIDLKIAKSIIRSFCDLQRNSEKDLLLLQHSLDIITDSINALTFHEVDGMLTKLLSKYIEGYNDFYHEEYLDACAKYLIDKNFSFEQSLWVLRKICRFNHVSLPLLDYLSGMVLKEPWLLEQSPAGMLFGFITGLSQADYKPQNWDQIKELMVKCVENHQDRQDFPWLRLVLDMCVLDCWSQPLFKKIFNDEFLDKYLDRDYNTLDKLQLLTLHHCASTLAPWTDGPSVPSKFLDPVIELNGTHHTVFPLLPALAHGLGGHAYVLTGVYTKLGHFLDHVVVMRKGGYPVAINFADPDQITSKSQRNYVEDLDLPPDCTIISVRLLSPSMSSINNDRVRGIVRLQVNTIEALGISVVVVLQSVWNNIMESEKIPYLMQAIHQKMENNQPTEVVVPV